MAEQARHGELLEAPLSARVSPLSKPTGFLCQTLLHTAVHDKHFMPFAVSGLGPDLAKKFDTELRRKCKRAYTPDAWAQLWVNYTGTWTQNSINPSDNAIFGSMGQWLNEERKKSEADSLTWDKFRNGDSKESGMEGVLRHIANTSQPTTTLHRIMDFGCGDGVELSKLGRGLGLQAPDLLCLDVVDYVAKSARSKVTAMVAPATMPDYGNALQAHLESKKLRGTVSAVFSSVTFHHIVQPEMRIAALTFVRESLAPGGFFLLAEWDNVGVPIDFSIYFDLAHFLPQLFFSDPAPTEATLGPLSSCYLPVQGWVDIMKSNDLPLDEARSRLPWGSKDNKTLWLDPAQAADQTSGRNFLAVFTKETAHSL